jgi:membrane associated rhomboid family serine protease
MRYTRPDDMPPIVKNLIIINVLVWLAQLIMHQQQLTERLLLYPFMPDQLEDILIMQGTRQDWQRFQPYQIATSMFAHSQDSFMHLLFNMLTLWFFGRRLENVWGPKRFFIFYILCGVGASLIHLVIQYIRCDLLLDAYLSGQPYDQYAGGLAPVLGASGAIMGILVAFAYLFPNTEITLMFPPIPLPAKWLVLFMIAVDLFYGLSRMQGDTIARFAHLGGAVTGFILILIWNKTNRRHFY